MKVAICISGGIKYPEKSLESLKRISPKGFHVFIHTWNITDKGSYLQNIGKEQLRPYSKEQVLNFYKESTENRLHLLKYYNYEDLLIENFEDMKPTFQEYFDSMTFPSYQRKDVGFMSMYYSFFKSNELKCQYEKKNNMLFDRVVRMRFDSDIVNDIDVEALKYPLNLEKNTGDWGGLSDQFAIGDSKSMDHYCNIYHNLVNMQHVRFHPESLMTEHLSTVEHVEVPFNVRINGKDVLT